MASRIPKPPAYMKKSLEVNFDKESRSAASSIHGCIHTRPKFQFKRRKVPPVEQSRFPPKYFSAGPSINDDNQRNLLEEPSPFLYPKELEEFAHLIMTKAWRNDLRIKELKCKYNERHNIRTRNQADLLNRLYVKEPVIENFKAIQDMDQEFFTIVQGRPITEKLKIRDYIQTVRDVLKMKIVTGYREDDVLLIEEHLIIEQQMIDEIQKNFQTYVTAFEEFLFNDHTSAMKLLSEADKTGALCSEKYEEYKQLSKEYGAIRSILYNSEEKWRNCKLYQKFLYVVSPMSWRREHDFYYQQENEVNTTKDESGLFGKPAQEAAASLEDLINQFMEDCTTQHEPKLYFTEPEQLLDVFRFIELQNLNSLLHTEELAVPLENVKEGMRRAEELFTAEINSLQEMIDKLSGGISWEEERAKCLEDLAMELINGEFKKIVTNEEFLNLQVLVEDVYETRVAPNDANLSMEDMMKTIEIRFREEMMKLDKIPAAVISKIEATTYQEEAKAMRIAERAARELFELDRLFYQLKRVFSPPFVRTTKELKFRSPPVNPPRYIPPPPRSLTQKEIDYLNFFTDYCRHTDEIIDYGIDINKPLEQHEDEEEKKSIVENKIAMKN